MPGMLSVGLSGLNAAQVALNTTSHNISNASVQGFNRQQAVQVTLDPMFTGQGFIGQGTRVETVRRIYSGFLEQQVMTADTNRMELETYSAEIAQINNLLADSSAGLAPALEEFFRGVHDVASNPASIPSRQSMLSLSEALVSRFQSMNNRFIEIRDGIEAQIGQSIDSINTLGQEIAELNQRIVAAQVAGPTVPANDLLDLRQNLIAQLNQQVRVTTTTESDGSLSVFIGTGQPLVIGANSYSLTTTTSADDITRLTVGLNMPGGSTLAIPESLISGGTLGGLLRFRAESLDPAQNALGRIAVGIAETFNAQHRLGQDLNGNLGGNFFSPAAPRVQNLPDPTTGIPPTATLNVAVVDVADLTTADYLLSFDGTNYQLRHQSNGSVIYTGATLPANVEGITITLGAGAIAAGDRFLIQPTRHAAADLDVTIVDTRLIAAGAPMRMVASSANSGSANVTQGSVVSTTGFASAPPHIGNITATFDAGTNQFTVTGALPATLAYNPTTEGAGKTFTFTNPNFSFTVSGAPADGDAFTFSSNDGGVSDNRNAVALAQLQSAKTMIGGGASYQYAYSQMVSDVGNKARQINVSAESQTKLLEQAEAAKQGLSGVNLDEEAANLIRFQQAYQASARVMAIASRLFDDLLSVARG